MVSGNEIHENRLWMLRRLVPGPVVLRNSVTSVTWSESALPSRLHCIWAIRAHLPRKVLTWRHLPRSQNPLWQLWRRASRIWLSPSATSSAKKNSRRPKKISSGLSVKPALLAHGGAKQHNPLLQFILGDIRLVTLNSRYEIILPEILRDEFQLLGEFSPTPCRFALLVCFGRPRSFLSLIFAFNRRQAWASLRSFSGVGLSHRAVLYCTYKYYEHIPACATVLLSTSSNIRPRV